MKLKPLVSPPEVSTRFNPINTLSIPLQYPVLDHVPAYRSGVIVVLSDDLVKLLFGVFGIGGEIRGDVAQNCELLG